MKRLAIGCLLFLWATLLFAQSSQTISSVYDPGRSYATISITWTAAANGSYTSYSIDSTFMEHVRGWFLYMMETDPGATAPTDDYDITITDTNGFDVLGGVGADRDTSNTEAVMPQINGVDAPYPTDAGLTLNISGNSVNAATGIVKLYFVR